MQKKKITQATHLTSQAIDKATANIQAMTMNEKLNQLKFDQLKTFLKQQQEKSNQLTKLFKTHERKKSFSGFKGHVTKPSSTYSGTNTKDNGLNIHQENIYTI